LEVEGVWGTFHTEIDDRHRIVRYDLASGRVTPLANDTHGHTHGSFVLQQERALLAHSNRGGTHSIWKFPLDGSAPVEIDVARIQIRAHATMSRNGRMAFDSPQSLDPT
jgi:hypothetical protein